MNDPHDHPLRYSVHSRLREFHLRRMLPAALGGRMLDVGCGLGYLTGALGKGLRCFGMDYDVHSLHGGTPAEGGMVRGDASLIPFADSAFDVVLCSELLEHLPEGKDQQALFELCRVLKPGGRLLVTVPSLEGLRAATALRNLGHDDPSGGEYHYRMGYSWTGMKAMIDAVPGLALVERRYAMFLFSELFMDLLKWTYFRKNKLKEHSDIMDSKNSGLFRAYRRFFPLLHAAFLLEDMTLARLLKGHILILSLTRTGS